ncbi:MAG: hypothetical protein ACPGID_10565 [Rubricella sp.]
MSVLRLAVVAVMACALAACEPETDEAMSGPVAVSVASIASAEIGTARRGHILTVTGIAEAAGAHSPELIEAGIAGETLTLDFVHETAGSGAPAGQRMIVPYILPAGSGITTVIVRARENSVTVSVPPSE